MNFDIPHDANMIMEKLEDAGYKAYIVGGAVRDFFMNKKAKDIDIATDALPEVVMDMFDHVEENSSIEFGTVFVKTSFTPVTNPIIEVTTFRRDITRGRHPKVEYTTDIKEDAERRDFTINAIYIDRKGTIVSPLGKYLYQHFNRRDLFTVGKPEDRFQEDPLRILRAVRFMALGFTPSLTLFDYMNNNKDKLCELLGEISGERARDEFMKSISINPRTTLTCMRKYGILRLMFPELDDMFGFDQEVPEFHKYDLWEHSIRTAEYMMQMGARPDMILIALFHDIGKVRTKEYKKNGTASFLRHDELGAEMVYNILKRYKYSNKRINLATGLTRHHMRLHQSHTRYNLIKTAAIMEKLGIHERDCIMMYKADLWAARNEYSKIESLPPVPKLPVSSEDIMLILKEKFGTYYQPSFMSKMIDKAKDVTYKRPRIRHNKMMEVLRQDELVEAVTGVKIAR